MTSNHPRTPQSPSQTSFGAADIPSKPATSPRHTESLPTPAHSINGSMSSITSDSASEALLHDESSNKRKRDPEDLGDRDQKKVHLEDGRLRIEDLHLDVGEKYLFCRTRKAPFFPKDLTCLLVLYARQYPLMSLGHHLPKYLVNMDLVRSTPCSSPHTFARSV